MKTTMFLILLFTMGICLGVTIWGLVELIKCYQGRPSRFTKFKKHEESIPILLTKTFNIPPEEVNVRLTEEHQKEVSMLTSPGVGRITEKEYAGYLLRAKEFEMINFNDPIHIYVRQNSNNPSWKDYRSNKGRYIKRCVATKLMTYSSVWRNINYIILDSVFYIVHNHPKTM